MTTPPHAYPTPVTGLSRTIGNAGMWGGFRFLGPMAAVILNISAAAQTITSETGPTGVDIIPTDLPAHASSVRSSNQPLSLLPGTIPTETRIEAEIEIPSLADQYQRTITGQPPIRPVRQLPKQTLTSTGNSVSTSAPTASPAAKTTQSAAAAPRTTGSDLVETATPAQVINGTGFLIQLGAFQDRFTAETYWASFSIRYPELVGTHEKIIVSANLGSRGIYHRLQLVGFEDSKSAKKQCRQLKADGTDCFATAR